MGIERKGKERKKGERAGKGRRGGRKRELRERGKKVVLLRCHLDTTVCKGQLYVLSYCIELDVTMCTSSCIYLFLFAIVVFYMYMYVK